MSITTWVVRFKTSGREYFLRGTFWAFEVDRATRHATGAEAQATLDKARKYMTAKVYDAAEIINVTFEEEGA